MTPLRQLCNLDPALLRRRTARDEDRSQGADYGLRKFYD